MATPGLVWRELVLQQRVIQLLRLPNDNAVFDMNLPGASTSAINTVGTPDDAIVLKSISVEFLPVSSLW